MKKRHFNGALIISILLLVQPIGFYIHVLSHNFDEASVADDHHYKVAEASCGLCSAFFNQTVDIQKARISDSEIGVSRVYTSYAAPNPQISDSSQSSRGPPAN